MGTRIRILVEDTGTFMVEPDKWQFHTTRKNRKSAVVAALVAFVKQYDYELEEASRDLFNALDVLKPVLRAKANAQTATADEEDQ